MKKLTNLFAWITLAVVLTVGAVGVNAGIIVGDPIAQCNGDVDSNGIMIADNSLVGAIIANVPSLTGIMIADAPCRNGIMIAD